MSEIITCDNDVINNDVFIDEDEVTNNNILDIKISDDINNELNKKHTFVDYVFLIKKYNTEQNIDLDYLLQKISKDIQQKRKFINLSSDSIYILLYSSLMLYDELNNKDITKKISKQQFISMLNKCNNGENFNVKLLSDIYNKINKKINKKNK